MPWNPSKPDQPNVTGGHWNPPDVLLPEHQQPGWWVRVPKDVGFASVGQLSFKIFPIQQTSAFFSSEGSLDSQIYGKTPSLANFGGAGDFSPIIAPRHFINGDLKSEGVLSFAITPIIPELMDGLSAQVYPRFSITASFSGAGAASAEVPQLYPIVANLMGSGQLGAQTKQILNLLVPFASQGSLSAIIGLFKAVDFLGSGQLAANAFERYLCSTDFSGAGTLSVDALASYFINAPFSGTGTLTPQMLQKHLRTASLSGGGVLAATTGFPTFAPATQTYSTAGAYSYLIPYWCRYIDVIGLGGGGGGEGGGSFNITNGKGGGPGVWDYTTWERGVHIPWSTANITGVVGAAGVAGATNLANGGVGGASTITATGAGPRSAGGGAGGGTGGDSGVQNGAGTGNVVVQGITYTGSSASGGVGIAPGGGGAGGAGNAFGNGAVGRVGAAGQVWFRAYQ